MAGGGTEIMDSEEWSSRPSPSQGCPGAGCDAHHDESKGAALWITLQTERSCTAARRGRAFWDCTGDEPKAEKGRDQGALWSHKGGKVEG